MQPILILGLVAAAAITMSSGFLLQDTIDVWLQGAGYGTANAVDPVSHVSVDIDIDKQLNQGADLQLVTDNYWDNVITECSFHIEANEINDQNMNNDLTDDGVEEVICKLTENGVVKGEGSITFDNGGKIGCVQALDDSTPPVLVNTQVALPGDFCPSQHYVITDLNWADGTPSKINEWTDVLIVV